MPLIIPASSSGGSSNNQGGGGGGGLGPLSRIYAEYENSQKAKKKQAVVKKRSADRMDGGGGGGTIGVDDGGGGTNKKKKIRSEWGSSSNPPQRSSSAGLKERPLIDTNVNVPVAAAAADGKSTCTKLAQKGGRVLNQMHVKPTSLCNFDGGCTDNSIKDGLCKTHWCAVNLCAHDGCIKLAWSKGFCREHNNFRKNSNHVHMSKHDRVEEDDAKISTKDEERDTGMFLQVKEEAKTMEVKELVDKKKQKQNASGVNEQSSQRKSCTAERCQNQSVVNGVCFRHGAKRKLCGTDACTNLSIRGGVCFRHGANRKLCKEKSCTNLTQRNGVCVMHGASAVDAEETGSIEEEEEEADESNAGGPVLCVEIPPLSEASSDLSKSSSVESDDTYELKDTNVATFRSVSASSTETASGSRTEANNSSLSSSHEECTCGVVNGVRCIKHKKRRKPCSFEDCTNQAVTGGVCIKHGAKVRRCSHDGCDKVVQKRGLCRKHGANKGDTTCSFDGCNNSEVEGGLCLQHCAREEQGEKRATCSYLLCTSAAVDGEVCIQHKALSSINDPSPRSSTNPVTRGCTLTKSGRKVKPCKSEGCTNRAIQGGTCFRHGAKAHRKLCSSDGCKNYVVRGGICIKHGANQVLKKNPTEEEEGETKNETPVQSLKQEEENSSSWADDDGEMKDQDELFKRIDQLEDNCADILLLLKNDG